MNVSSFVCPHWQIEEIIKLILYKSALSVLQHRFLVWLIEYLFSDRLSENASEHGISHFGN